jgi:hypothetical protein
VRTPPLPCRCRRHPVVAVAGLHRRHATAPSS